ncbi:MAG TPA: bifunctional diaminohydroxyphosphoribosylaminopyrimidine deaminase/5-amino-6-(5-phosphoribosylamino)uracil reductase RibD [Acidobacteriaceae bacterium]|nr:bifunctional diaminohydroxyphosphoribosylaminopyrimidine deaminase/5-amino-6-(5-phosphoribosylamino)uracil reductase RibD [Acidobacteriaceae bacterium]
MRLLPADERGLRRALELASDAAAFASPNPTVGCVLLRQETTTVLGEGAHFYDNFDHAEIAALKQARAAGHDLHGATAYVTLEPCVHHGRTGPCSDALMAAGIRRCVVATFDPNPLVRGKGLARLSAAGVEVMVLPAETEMAQRARQLNDAFAFAIRHERPFVTLKAALSVDGKIAPAVGQRNERGPYWLTGSAARADVQRLRHASDAILTGIGTVLADDPELTDRTGLPRRRPLLRVVLDPQLRIPLASKLVRSAAAERRKDLFVMCDEESSEEHAAELRDLGVEIHRLPRREGRLDLRVALDVLNERHVRSVLTEAGSALNGSLLRDGLADRVVLYFAEQELGASALPFAEGTSPYLVQQQMSGVERSTFANAMSEDVRGEDVKISGYLHDPWAGM